jgi:hypothetical protein
LPVDDVVLLPPTLAPLAGDVENASGTLSPDEKKR